jgi:23S rRNA pseudouridine1911/1915/1917 synthase
MRLDHFIKNNYPDLSNNEIITLIKIGKVKVNKQVVNKKSKNIKTDDEVVLEKNIKKNYPAENIPLNIIAETDNYIVINKQKNLTVHPCSNQKKGTLLNALYYHYGDFFKISSENLRPGIVHRLDKDTTGIIIVAKNNKFHRYLSAQIKNRLVKKTYLALVYGKPQDGLILGKIAKDFNDKTKMNISKNGKESKTEFKVLEYNKDLNVSLVKIILHTGRTHQIRAHFLAISNPLVGDLKYFDTKKTEELKYNFLNLNLKFPQTQCLHSYSYTFVDLDYQEKTFIAEENDFLKIFNLF